MTVALLRLRPRPKLAIALFALVLVLLLSTAFYAGDTESLVAEWTLDKLPFSIHLDTEATPRPEGTCSPDEYAQGQWVQSSYKTRPGPLSKPISSDGQVEVLGNTTATPEKMSAKEDLLRYARMNGCASGDNFWWQFAAIKEEQWDRFPRVFDWEWVPGGRCTQESGLREWVVEEVVRELVEGGGWLLIGDSVTGNHFFSLSCLLYPHVVINKATSNARDRPQDLYLNPSSPFLSNLQLPDGFNMTTTPLVSFRRVDLLWSVDDLTSMHKGLHPEFYIANTTFELFGKEPVWTSSPDVYLDAFLGSLPTANYKTMVVSTAGHWTTNLFAGYHRAQGSDKSTLPVDSSPESLDIDAVSDELEPMLGYDGLLVFFEEVMARWALAIQDRLKTSLESTSTPQQQVLVRAYLPGHDACHNERDPWVEIKAERSFSYNWGEIPKYNEIWETLLSQQSTSYPNIHYLGIDRPGRLRPDGHVATDCLHIMTGPGVLEGWSHHIWHYITKEVLQ